MSDNWLKDIKKKADNVRYDVSDEMFDSIWESVSRKRVLRRRMGAIIAAMATSAAVLALVLTIKPKEEMTFAGQEETPLMADAGNSRLEDKGSVVEPIDEIKPLERLPDTKIAVYSQLKQPEAATADSDNPEAKLASNETPIKNHSVRNDKSGTKTDTHKQPDKDYLLVQILEPEKEKARHRGVHMSLSGATPGTGNETVAKLLNSGTNPGLGDLYGTPDDEQSISINHNLPIGLRFMVSYNLSDRFSIEGGVSYAFQSSSISYLEKIAPAYVHPIWRELTFEPHSQQLHFIGIPVGVRYNFMDYGRTSFYLRAGGAVEKCVSYTLANEDGQNKARLQMDPLFWSAEASLGAQIDIIGPLYLFAEGGASYHFANSTGNLTYYGAHPLMFSLQAGARIEIFR